MTPELLGYECREQKGRSKMDTPDVKKEINDGLKALEDRVVTSIVAKIEERSKKETKVVMGATEEEKIVDGGGWKHLGHFMVDVRAARTRPSDMLQRYNLAVRAISGQGELVDADGGFLAPASYSNTIMSKSLEGSFLSRCMSIPCSGPMARVPAVVDDIRKPGTVMYGGVTTAYVPEGGKYPDSGKVNVAMVELKPVKLVSKVAITEELLEDNAISAEALVSRCVPEAIRLVREQKALFGTGAGEPLGAFGLFDGTHTRCAVQVTRSGANVVAIADVLGMAAALYGPSVPSAIWLYNRPKLFVNLRQLAISNYGQGAQVQSSMIESFEGIPAQSSIHAVNDMGTEGDIMLADFSQYLLATKGGVRSKVSLELRFDYGENVYCFVIREDGQPWWKSALRTYDKGGSLYSDVSPFVWLNTNT